MEADVPCARMKDGVILRVSKHARMGIDDAPLYPLRPPGNDKLLPVGAQSCFDPSPRQGEGSLARTHRALPKRINETLVQGRELAKAAKGLR